MFEDTKKSIRTFRKKATLTTTAEDQIWSDEITKANEELAQNNQTISETVENTTENEAILDIDDKTPNNTVANNTQDLIPLKPEHQQETKGNLISEGVSL